MAASRYRAGAVSRPSSPSAVRPQLQGLLGSFGGDGADNGAADIRDDVERRRDAPRKAHLQQFHHRAVDKGERDNREERCVVQETDPRNTQTLSIPNGM